MPHQTVSSVRLLRFLIIFFLRAVCFSLMAILLMVLSISHSLLLWLLVKKGCGSLYDFFYLSVVSSSMASREERNAPSFLFEIFFQDEDEHQKELDFLSHNSQFTTLRYIPVNTMLPVSCLQYFSSMETSIKRNLIS